VILYKYCHRKAIRHLTEGKVLLTRPEAFNDPFETSPSFESVTEEHEIPLPDNPTQAQRSWRGEERRRLGEREKQSLLLTHASVARKHAPIVGLSLSERKDSLLMWAHYAYAHAGFLIGFDSTNPIFVRESPSRQLAAVRYSTWRPKNLRFEQMTLEEKFLTKSIEWAYEHEWRVIDSVYQADSRPRRKWPFSWGFTFRPAALQEVILGCRMDPVSRFRIERWLDQPAFKHVRLMQATLDEREYKLNFSDLPRDCWRSKDTRIERLRTARSARKKARAKA
jgi:hypothetical protein